MSSSPQCPLLGRFGSIFADLQQNKESSQGMYKILSNLLWNSGVGMELRGHAFWSKELLNLQCYRTWKWITDVILHIRLIMVHVSYISSSYGDGTAAWCRMTWRHGWEIYVTQRVALNKCTVADHRTPYRKLFETAGPCKLCKTSPKMQTIDVCFAGIWQNLYLLKSLYWAGLEAPTCTLIIPAGICRCHVGFLLPKLRHHGRTPRVSEGFVPFPLVINEVPCLWLAAMTGCLY